MHQQASAPETIHGITHTVDEAVALLRNGRYSDLDAHLARLQQQAADLETLKQHLFYGARAEPGLAERCEQLGKSLFVLSQVAKQVATVEAGIAQLIAGPSDGSYDRGGHCENPGGFRFQQEA